MCVIITIVLALLITLITPATFTVSQFYGLLENKTVCDECLIPVILQTSAKNIHLISAPQTDVCPTNMLNIPQGAAWTSFDRAEDLVLTTEWEDLCLIRASNTSGLLILLKNCPKCQRAKIILQYTIPNRTGMRTLFDQCWKLGITDVVVVEDRANFCYVYSYFPFGKNKCFNTFPVLMSSWDKRLTGSLDITHTFYPDKLSNLYSCPLQVEYGKETKEAGYQIRWAGLVPFLLKAMKAKPNIIYQVDGSFPNVIDSRTDLLFDIFYQNFERLPKFVFSPISSNGITGICYPVQKRPVVEWSRILNEFSRSVWCGVVVCATLIVFYMYFIFFQRKTDIVYVFLGTLRALLTSPVPIFPVKRWQDRVCIPLWLYFCLLLNSAYQSSLKSKLTVPLVDDPIASIEDFKKLDIPIHVTYATYKFTTETMLSEPRHKPITDKLVVFKNLSHNEVLMSHNGKAAYICEDDDVDVYLNGSYRLLPDTLFETLESICVLPRPSPYERLFKRAFLRIFDAGAIGHVKKKSIHSEILLRQIIDNYVPLSLRVLSGAFVVWILGACAAFIFFLAEIFVFKTSMGIENIDIWCVLSGALHYKAWRGACDSRTKRAVATLTRETKTFKC